jgi:hypothetical protein
MMNPKKYLHMHRNLAALFVPALLMLFSPVAWSSILPEGLTVAKQFAPGYGAPIGKILLLQGKIVIVHQGIESGFPAAKGKPLFKGDTIYTDRKSRIRFRMNDGSVMTLSSQTKLTINKSIYNPGKKRRTSFLSLALGKARFLVTRMLNFNKSSFKVKAGTFVAGVRGSDFIIVQTGDKTAVSTLEKTSLEVTRMDAPEMKPILMSSFQRTSGEPGGSLKLPWNLPPQEIATLKQDFSLPGDPGYSPETGGQPEDRTKAGKEKKENGGSETTASGTEKQEPAADETSAEPVTPPEDTVEPLPADGMPDTAEGFLIPADELESPDFGLPEFDPPAEPPELPPILEPENPVEEPPQVPEVDEELPGLPGLPQ